MSVKVCMNLQEKCHLGTYLKGDDKQVNRKILNLDNQNKLKEKHIIWGFSHFNASNTKA